MTSSLHTPNVADRMWEMLYNAGVRRCYGIIGDALNPIIDALRRNGKIEFIHVRHEESGVFAAVAEAYYTQQPVCVCGTAGPGVTHLINGLLDAKKESAPVIAIAGDVATRLMDSNSFEELNPHLFFSTASYYTGRIISPKQLRSVVFTAIQTAISLSGPTVISLAGDIAVKAAPEGDFGVENHVMPTVCPRPNQLQQLADLINTAQKVTIFGGDGCRDAFSEVIELAERIKAPVGYSYRGKQWLQGNNPYNVGMTGLIGWGSCYDAMHECDLLLLLGTDFPFVDFYPTKNVKKVQIDIKATHLGRRTAIDLALVGDVKDTLEALLPLINTKDSYEFLNIQLNKTRKSIDKMQKYASHDAMRTPIRPEYLFELVNNQASSNAIFSADTGTACIWMAHYINPEGTRGIFGSLSWASMASAMSNAMGIAISMPNRQAVAFCGDGGFTMMMGDLLTIVQRKLPIKIIILNNSRLDFVHIEMEEAGIEPFGTDMTNPNFAEVATAMGAKGIRVEKPEDLKRAIEEGFAYNDGPVLFDIVVDKEALALPPHITIGEAEGFALALAKEALHGKISDAKNTIEDNLNLF